MNKDDLITTRQNTKKASVKNSPCTTDEDREKIAADVGIFLQSGGQITYIDTGVTSDAILKFVYSKKVNTNDD